MAETVFNVLKLIGLAFFQMLVSLMLMIALLVALFFGCLMWFLMSPYWLVKRLCRGWHG